MLALLPQLPCLTQLRLRCEQVRATDIQYVNNELAGALAELPQLRSLYLELNGIFNSDRMMAMSGEEEAPGQSAASARSLRLAGAVHAMTGVLRCTAVLP